MVLFGSVFETLDHFGSLGAEFWDTPLNALLDLAGPSTWDLYSSASQGLDQHWPTLIDRMWKMFPFLRNLHITRSCRGSPHICMVGWLKLQFTTPVFAEKKIARIGRPPCHRGHVPAVTKLRGREDDAREQQGDSGCNVNRSPGLNPKMYCPLGDSTSHAKAQASL